MTINEMLCYVEKIIKRPLNSEEILIIGMAYNEGLREGVIQVDKAITQSI